jgi:hypothetical protein
MAERPPPLKAWLAWPASHKQRWWRGGPEGARVSSSGTTESYARWGPLANM